MLQIKHSAEKEAFFLFSLLLQGCDATYETCGKRTSFTLIFFFFYEAPCVILSGTRWWNRFLGISSPSVGNLQSVRRCGRNVIWSAGAAAAVSHAAAAVATHDGFPGGAAARPISGILNNIPQQRLLWVSIYIQNAVFEAWEMCSRYPGEEEPPGTPARPFEGHAPLFIPLGDMFAPDHRVRRKLEAGFEGCCQTHKSPWGCVLANHSPGSFRLRESSFTPRPNSSLNLLLF